MLFGRNNANPDPPLLLADFPIGTRLQIGVDKGYWMGELAGFRNNSVLIDNAQPFANSGSALEESRSTAQIPFNIIAFVSEAPEEKKAKSNTKEIATNNVHEYSNQFLSEIRRTKNNLDKSVGYLAEYAVKFRKSAESFLNNVFGSNP